MRLAEPSLGVSHHDVTSSASSMRLSARYTPVASGFLPLNMGEFAACCTMM